MRYRLRFFGVLALLLLTAASAQAQTGYDRRGGDYFNFPVRNGDPAACATRCEHDAHCRAWSFSYPRTVATSATCWLKNRVPPSTQDDCCVSGVSGAAVLEPRKGPLEFSIDRTGGDYRNFDMPTDAEGGACKTACEGDNKCRAWTYVRPGYIDPTARCFLKDRIRPPRQKPCCISGVVR